MSLPTKTAPEVAAKREAKLSAARPISSTCSAAKATPSFAAAGADGKTSAKPFASSEARAVAAVGSPSSCRATSADAASRGRAGR